MENGYARSVNTIDLFDCVARLRKVGRGPQYSRTPQWTKWETVPPLLEMVSEALIVNSWEPLIKLLLASVSSEPIYSTLLARALHHSKEELVQVILSLWPWKKLICVSSPVLAFPGMGTFTKPESMAVLVLMKAFAHCVNKGSLETLQFLDISNASVSYWVDEGLQSIIKLGKVHVAPFKRESQRLQSKKKKYTIYLHNMVDITNRHSLLSKDINSKVSSDTFQVSMIACHGTASIDLAVEELNAEKTKEVCTLKKLTLTVHPHLNNLTTYLTGVNNIITKFQNIVDITFRIDSKDMLDGVLKHIDSMSRGLRFLSLACKKPCLKAEHLMALATSKHASTLQVFDLCYDDSIDNISSELAHLIEKLSGTLKRFVLDCMALSVTLLPRLFKALEHCKHLAVLDLRTGINGNRGIIHSFALVDVAPLGGLPDFMLFCTPVETSEHAKDLELSRILNDYRAEHPPSTYRQSIHVVVNLQEIDEIGSESDENSFGSSDAFSDYDDDNNLFGGGLFGFNFMNFDYDPEDSSDSNDSLDDENNSDVLDSDFNEGDDADQDVNNDTE